MEVKEDPCEFCGMPSHLTNWSLLRQQRTKHREEKGLFYTVREWWSI